MRLSKAVQSITHISDNEDINNQNYLESLSYVGTLYNFISKIKIVVPLSDTEFIPSFKGRYACAKLGITSTEKESEMKCIVIKCKLFLEDDVKNRVKEIISPLCEDIQFENEYGNFILI